MLSQNGEVRRMAIYDMIGQYIELERYSLSQLRGALENPGSLDGVSVLPVLFHEIRH